ncbi:MAG: adenosylmethionine--8-amino-7-oxononanoate transaminase [Planctomycetes bacterium]|nr:adenosylmethionine--8-amino-7-oxononanoate transaminase [Planctomycetota bacterium]
MNTTQLRQLDNAHVWHPFTPMLEHGREDIPVIVSGDRFHLIDTDGRRYLDGVSSLWCNVHGHRVLEIDKAIREQLGQIAHSTLLGLDNVPSIRLAAALVRRLPAGLTRVFYSDNGSTAVEAALKIAYQYYRQRRTRPENRELFVSLSGAYHGDTVGSVSVGGIDLFHGIYGGLLFKTLKVPSPASYRLPPGHTPQSWEAHCLAELERVFAAYRGKIAGFVIEPIVQGAAGILVHPPGWLTRIRELTRAEDVLLIADEVATGFGRTGTFLACEQEQVVPDLLCLSKGITGGYMPLAATVATEEIYDAFLDEPAEAKTFFHGHTYTGNPLACAAALASLELFEQSGVLGNVRDISALMARRLTELSDHPHVGDIRQKGTMVGIELVRDRADKSPYAATERLGHRVVLAARQRGVIIRPLGDVIVLMPAPAMPAGLVDELCSATFQAIRDVCGSA